MNKKLTKQLLTKYPKLLPTLRSHQFEFNDGWYSIVDNMLNEIQSYINNPSQDAKLNSFHYWWNRRWYDFIYPIINDPSFKENWPRLVKFANDKLIFEYYTNNPVDQVNIMILKEKFGSLRAQGVSGGDEITAEIIKFYCRMSDYVCENCGTTKNVKHVLNKIKWEKTLCPTCAKQFKSSK